MNGEINQETVVRRSYCEGREEEGRGRRGGSGERKKEKGELEERVREKE